MGEAREPDLWAGSFRSYAGWVPNVRSHLSFSMIGAAKAAHTFTDAYRKRPSRLVLVHQHRVVNDYPLWSWLAKLIVPEIALHWLLEAETGSTDIPIIRDGEPEPQRDRQGMLRGTIQLWSRMDSKRDQTTQTETIKQIDALLLTPSADPDGSREPDEIDRSTIALKDAFLDLVAHGSPAIALQFALMRTGECRIWYPQQPDDVDERLLDWVAQQGYYFIKDVVHDHTHHDATSDQITPLYRFGRHFNEPDHSDEVAWRRETLWSLSREIERLNREGGLTDQRKSLGIIAYAEAFQASLMGHVRNTGGNRQFEASTSVHDYDFKHLKDSIKASIDVNATRLAQKIQITIAAPTTFLATTSLVSSLVSTHNGALPRVQNGAAEGTITLGGLDSWVPSLADNPAHTGALAMIGFLMLIAYFLLDGRAGIYNGAQRWLSQLGRALMVTLFDSLLLQWLALLAYHLLLIALTLVVTSVVFGWLFLGAGL